MVSNLSRTVAPSARARTQHNLPGILGGLGPLAHIEFEQRLLQHSTRLGANCDQDHPNWLLFSAASTPDRTQHLLGEGPNCTPDLVRSAQLLASMGAHFLVVTCNTAHAFHHQVQAQIDIPWLHMMDETARYVETHFPEVRKVGVLATDGTLRSQLYPISLACHAISTCVPSINSPIQQRVMQSIYHLDWGVKSGGAWVSDIAIGELIAAAHWLKAQGAELMIAGCTEISIGLAKTTDLPLNWIDPLDVMAERTLELAYQTAPIETVPIETALIQAEV
jgi:aspartate racemase